MPNQTHEQLYRRSDRAIFTTVDREVVALDVQAGQCFGFNRPASAIWDLLDRPRSIDEICARLRQQFDVTEDECRRNVAELLDQLVSDRIVVEVSAGEH